MLTLIEHVISRNPKNIIFLPVNTTIGWERNMKVLLGLKLQQVQMGTILQYLFFIFNLFIINYWFAQKMLILNLENYTHTWNRRVTNCKIKK